MKTASIACALVVMLSSAQSLFSAAACTTPTGYRRYHEPRAPFAPEKPTCPPELEDAFNKAIQGKLRKKDVEKLTARHGKAAFSQLFVRYQRRAGLLVPCARQLEL